MEITFDFREEHSRLFGKIKRPVVPVIMSNGDKQEAGTFYVDSGADISLIPRTTGKRLGFTIEKEDIREVKGIGERGIPILIRKLKLQIGDKEINAEVAWSLVEEVPLLLGRKDVFDNFEITFKDNKTIFRY